MARPTPTAAPPSRPSRPGWFVALVALLAAAAGFVVAALASLVARIVWRTDVISIPWGLLLAVAGSASLVVLARSFSRSAGFAAVSGWVVGIFYALNPRPEGDYVIAGDALGISFLLLSLVAIMCAAAWGGGGS